MQLRSNASGAVKVIIAEKDRKRATNGGSNARVKKKFQCMPYSVTCSA